MTALEKIDKRLDLLPTYLRDKIDNWHLSPFGQMHLLDTQGILLINKQGLLTFNEWLSLWGYSELV